MISMLVQFALVVLAIIPSNQQTGETGTRSDTDCPSLANADSMSQSDLIDRMTHKCRYDRRDRPTTFGPNGTTGQPIAVYASAYISYMQNLELHDSQLVIHALLKLSYVDSRLNSRHVSPKRQSPSFGGQWLRDKVWVPHVCLSNERTSRILGINEKDILTTISPDGTVTVAARIEATLHCTMNLHMFPFDVHTCEMVYESWMYNTAELELHWDPTSPVTLGPDSHLSEYTVLRAWTHETIVVANRSDTRGGESAGHYSSIIYSVHLSRRMGFYVMYYFLPSMIMVAISWLSFWLAADQVAPRVLLGTSTLLAFISLASAQGKNLPTKVDYMKMSDAWNIGCAAVIFASLLEFAVVNTVWRRQKNIELKKANSKHILMSTLIPGSLRKHTSSSSLESGRTIHQQSWDRYLSVPEESFASTQTLPSIIVAPSSTEDLGEDPSHQPQGAGHIAVTVEPTSASSGPRLPISMTPQKVAYWIDRRSRILFPSAYLLFNVVYWAFVVWSVNTQT